MSVFAAGIGSPLVMTSGRAEATLQLMPPPSFIRWYQQAAESLQDQPVLDGSRCCMTRCTRWRACVLMKIPDGERAGH